MQYCLPVFRAGQIQDGVIDCYKEIARLAFESARQGPLTKVFDDVIPNQAPKLSGRNPHAAFVANDFR
jgi:hypothetical protein